MGKAKIKRFVDTFSKQGGLQSISESTIGKVIRRNNYFFVGRTTGKRIKADSTKRLRVKLCPKPNDTRPGYIQLDGFKFYYLSKYYYFLTAVDIVTKQAWVVLVLRLNSKYAADFLGHILKTSYYPVHTIQTDNGSEFKKYFEQAAKVAGLTHLFSYPKQPKTNGFVERVNWTVQDEFLTSFEDLLLYPEEFNKKLEEWMLYYNQVRPHQSLVYLTPYEYTQKGGLSQK